MRKWAVKLANRTWAAQVGDPVLDTIEAIDFEAAKRELMLSHAAKKARMAGQGVFLEPLPSEEKESKGGKPVSKPRRNKRQIFDTLAGRKGGLSSVRSEDGSVPSVGGTGGGGNDSAA